jgi:hypothetical protein
VRARYLEEPAQARSIRVMLPDQILHHGTGTNVAGRVTMTAWRSDGESSTIAQDLCWLSQLDEKQLDAVSVRPRLNPRGDELGTLVDAGAFRISTLPSCIIKHTNNRGASDNKGEIHRDRKPAVFVKERQGTKMRPCEKAVRNEILRTDIV